MRRAAGRSAGSRSPRAPWRRSPVPARAARPRAADRRATTFALAWPTVYRLGRGRPRCLSRADPAGRMVVRERGRDVETVFLGCFLFGVVFTGLTTLLGAASSTVHVGHFLGHGWHGPHVHTGHTAGHGGAEQPLFLFGVSSLVAFLTWFGAAGYVLTRWFAWPLLATLVLGIGAGLVAAVLVARFLALLRAGERVMDPRDYRMVGTVARVTVGIPGDGVGEIVFTK